jgi:predicted metal-dependent phosphoesterase TrpH
MIDLHCHSVFSDGTKTPAELVKMADAKRIKSLALTDHDTIAGLPDFFAAKGNVERIAGTEISVDFEPGTMHVVGLFLDHQNTALQEKLTSLLKARKDRNASMLKAVSELVGREITEVDITTDNKGELGRPHIAKFLIKEGVVFSMEEAFDTYLGKGKPMYRERNRLSFEESAEMIHDAGGVAVLAHPFSLRIEKEQYEQYIKGLADKGLDAVESFCSYHSHEDTEFFNDIAKRLGLLISAGSDYHGDNKSNVKLGKWNSPLRNHENVLYLLRKKAESYK